LKNGRDDGITAVVGYGYSERGFDRGIQIGTLIAVGYLLWLVRERYATYVGVEENRWLINGGQRSFVDDKIDILLIVFVARAPHFIFRSWGGRMVIFFRDDSGRVRQTALPEALYTWHSLQAILKRLVGIKLTIELDAQYQLLISKKEPLDADLSQQLPRSLKEIEAYVASKYGPP